MQNLLKKYLWEEMFLQALYNKPLETYDTAQSKRRDGELASIPWAWGEATTRTLRRGGQLPGQRRRSALPPRWPDVAPPPRRWSLEVGPEPEPEPEPAL